jgi:hypothetical protein
MYEDKPNPYRVKTVNEIIAELQAELLIKTK